MTKSTITREQITAWMNDANYALEEPLNADDAAAARAILAMGDELLAAMGSEPVAWMSKGGPVLNGMRQSAHDFAHYNIPLYRHAQPAPVVPDGLRLALSNAGIAAPESDEMLFAKSREFVQDLVTWVKDRKPFQSVPGAWIPVSERMPPSRHEVLVGRWWGEKLRWCCKWATYIPGHPDAQSSGWLIPGASWTPTHWMPLPAAPQEVK